MREIKSIRWINSYEELQIKLVPQPGDYDRTDPEILVELRSGKTNKDRNRVVGSKMHYWVWSPYSPDVWKCLPTEEGAIRAVRAILDGKVKP